MPCFIQAPMSVVWDHIIIGMKVEVENKDSEVNQYPGVYSKSYWIASILRISGYYVLLRYEGFGQDGSKDFWMNITSEKVHPVGWCITKGKPLIPPKCESRVHSAFNRFAQADSKNLVRISRVPLKVPKIKDCNFHSNREQVLGLARVPGEASDGRADAAHQLLREALVDHPLAIPARHEAGGGRQDAHLSGQARIRIKIYIHIHIFCFIPSFHQISFFLCRSRWPPSSTSQARGSTSSTTTSIPTITVSCDIHSDLSK